MSAGAPNSEASGLTDDDLAAIYLASEDTLSFGHACARAAIAAHEAKRPPSTSAEAVASDIAQWLEGQGQPGYAHEIRFRNWGDPAPSTTVAAGEADWTKPMGLVMNPSAPPLGLSTAPPTDPKADLLRQLRDSLADLMAADDGDYQSSLVGTPPYIRAQSAVAAADQLLKEVRQ